MHVAGSTLTSIHTQILDLYQIKEKSAEQKKAYTQIMIDRAWKKAVNDMITTAQAFASQHKG